MLRAAMSIKSAPLLGIKGRRRPARSFKESHQFLSRDFFARHRTRRPAIEQERLDRKLCFAHFATLNHFNVINHFRAVLTSSRVSSWPPLKKRVVTSAPAPRNNSANSFVSDAGTIGSTVPAPIHTRMGERSGWVSGTNGTIARNRIAPDNISGRSNK